MQRVSRPRLTSRLTSATVSIVWGGRGLWQVDSGRRAARRPRHCNRRGSPRVPATIAPITSSGGSGAPCAGPGAPTPSPRWRRRSSWAERRLRGARGVARRGAELGPPADRRRPQRRRGGVRPAGSPRRPPAAQHRISFLVRGPAPGTGSDLAPQGGDLARCLRPAFTGEEVAAIAQGRAGISLGADEAEACGRRRRMGRRGRARGRPPAEAEDRARELANSPAAEHPRPHGQRAVRVTGPHPGRRRADGASSAPFGGAGAPGERRP